VDYQVPSVALAARILKMLSRYKYRSCSLKEIAEKLEVNKTTCLRVLRTLEKEDFVKYDPDTRRYSLGPYLIPLGTRASELNDTVASAMSELQSVAAATGMTTVLVKRLKDDRLIYIGSAEPPGEGVRIAVSVGQQFPITGAAFGRCFLAFDTEEAWQHFIQAGLRAYTPHTVTDPDKFIEILREVRRQGYAVSHSELTPGISAIAAPIFNRAGGVELVMACLVMTSQLTPEREEAAIQTLLQSTRKLSEWSGYQHRPNTL
jgi:IclR family KDG regulon transcriptional repressor